MRLLRGVLLGTFVLGLMACAPAGGGGTTGQTHQAQVTGTVTYRQRIALPEDALVKVRLADVSRQDVAALVLGEEVIETRGRQVPFSYAISYDPAAIQPSHRYAVSARIEVGGKLLFISDTIYSVITLGHLAQADLLLIQVR